MAIDQKFVGRFAVVESVKAAFRSLITKIDAAIASPTITTLTVDSSTAAATAGAATLNAASGKVTSEALTTAQNGIYTLTVTNSAVAAANKVFASVANGTNSQGTPMVGKVTPGAGSVVIEVINKHATSVAFNGTVVVSFLVVK